MPCFMGVNEPRRVQFKICFLSVAPLCLERYALHLFFCGHTTFRLTARISLNFEYVSTHHFTFNTLKSDCTSMNASVELLPRRF
jgi:hypothetical protein